MESYMSFRGWGGGLKVSTPPMTFLLKATLTKKFLEKNAF
jgi:hypothetical protein